MPLITCNEIATASNSAISTSLLKDLIKKRTAQLFTSKTWRDIFIPKYTCHNVSKIREQKLIEYVIKGDIVKLKEYFKTIKHANITEISMRNALYIAISKGYDQTAALLLDHGADVNQKTHDGYAAIHAACEKNNENGLKILIKHNADVNCIGPDHIRPLHIATQNGYHHLVRLLAQYQADIDVELTSSQYTPLMIASQLGYACIVELLLNAGADPYIEDTKGNTALHFAADKGYYQICYFLLTAGADPYIPNTDQDIPIDLAKYRGFSHIVNLLEGTHINMNEKYVNSAVVYNENLTKTLIQNRPELGPIIIKNRQKYAQYYNLGCIMEETE